MNTVISKGSFHGVKYDRSKDGKHTFTFEFVERDGRVDIFCRRHPGFNGQDSDPHRTHLFRSGKLCFHAGRGPKTIARAEELASCWAEYFLDYRRTGKAQF